MKAHIKTAKEADIQYIYQNLSQIAMLTRKH